MLRILLKFTGLLLLGLFTNNSYSAPVEQLVSTTANINVPSVGRQILFLSPEAQLQLKPALKLHAPILQPLVPIGRIQNAADDQTIIFFPSSLAADDEGQDNNEMWYNQIIQIIQMWGQVGGGGFPSIPGVQPPNIPGLPPIGGGGGGGGGNGGSSGGDGDKDDGLKSAPCCEAFANSKGSTTDQDPKQIPVKVEINPEAEQLPQSSGQAPASTIPLPSSNNDKKIFTISGVPQFYGNIDIFHNPVRPIFGLQALDPIKVARSMIDLKKSKESKEKEDSQRETLLPSNILPSTFPVQSGNAIPQALPLRSGVETEENKEEENENPIDPDYKPGVAAGRFAQFLIQQRVLHPENEFDNQKPPIQQFVTLSGPGAQEIPGSVSQQPLLPGNTDQQFIQPSGQFQYSTLNTFNHNQPGTAAQEFLQILHQPQAQPIAPSLSNQNQPGLAAQEFIQTLAQAPSQGILSNNPSQKQPGVAAQEFIQTLQQGSNQGLFQSNPSPQNQPGVAAQEFIQTLAQGPSPGAIIYNHPNPNQPGAAADEFLQTLGQGQGQIYTTSSNTFQNPQINPSQSVFQSLAHSPNESPFSKSPNQFQPEIATQEFRDPLIQNQDQFSSTSSGNQQGYGAQDSLQSSAPSLVNRIGPEISTFQISGQAQSLVPNNPKPDLKPIELDGSKENNERLSDDPSIAQARPVAIAITGKGGLAQSAPVGTAIAGEDGYALSSPSATAIAGDFTIPDPSLGEAEEDKRKKQ